MTHIYLFLPFKFIGRECFNSLNAVPLLKAAERWVTPYQVLYGSALNNLNQYLPEG